MKTLADFKRRVVIGQLVKTTYHQRFIGRNPDGTPIFGDSDMGIRPISLVQSAQFALKTPTKEGDFAHSYMNFPKLKDVEFIGEDTIRIFEEDRDGKRIPLLTYPFLKESENG